MKDKLKIINDYLINQGYITDDNIVYTKNDGDDTITISDNIIITEYSKINWIRIDDFIKLIK